MEAIGWIDTAFNQEFHSRRNKSMTLKRPIIPVLLTLGLAASIVLAQVPEPGEPFDPATRVQHHVQHLTKTLSLTSEQQQQATTIFTNAANGESSIHDSMKAAHQSLETAIKNNDQNGITQAATTIGNLTTQLVAAQAKAHAAFYQILTPDQQSKLNQFAAEGPRHGHGFGFGGPGHLRP
jgi:Spy/CpxP family protein refolding chaperone